MRVLWITNLILPAFAASQNLTASVREGWLSGLYAAVSSRRATATSGPEASATSGSADPAAPVTTAAAASGPSALELAVAYPAPAGADLPAKTSWNNTTWYSFSEDLGHPELYDPALETAFADIIADFGPDLVHIFGTEFPHARAALKAYGRPERSLLGIQGYCKGIAEAYMADLPEQVQKAATFRDIIRKDSLARQQQKFYERAENEREAILLAGHITGRTAYDERMTGEINPGRIYHKMNETLRDTFYRPPTWESGKAKPHRIFIPQGDYPLKGFHHLIEALAELKPDYPDAEVAVAGIPVTGEGGRRRVPLFLRIGAYGRYLRGLMTDLGVRDMINILGSLDPESMKREMLASGVFVLPSAVENSPNSMGEAMLLGLPVVASDTGGIPSLLQNGKEGILVKPGDVHGIAAAIRQIWDEPVIAGLYSENARKRALVTHDPETNLNRLFRIYEEICA